MNDRLRGLIAGVVLGFALGGGQLPAIAFDLHLPEWINFSIGVKQGPKEILIVYDTGTAQAPFERMLTNLRTGANDKYLADKNHKLYMLSRDAKDGDGNQAKPIAKWSKALDGLQLPAIVIGTPEGKLTYKQSLAPDVPADAVMSIIKSHGG